MFKFFIKHKIILALIIVVLVVGGYFGYKASRGGKETVSYTTAAVEKGTLVVSVSGTGQIAVSNQVDVKAKSSGDIVAINVASGQEVPNGFLLAQIDTTDAAKGLRDAQTALETARLELDELLAPVDELTLFQAENALTEAQNSKQKAEKNLTKAYEDGFNTVADAFLELPTVMTGMNSILFGNDFSPTQANLSYYSDAANKFDVRAMEYKAAADAAYQTARKAYDKNFQDYKATSRFSDTETIKALINETYETTKDIAEMIKTANNLIQFYRDKFTERNLSPALLSATHITTLNTYTGTASSNLSSLLSAQRSIDDYIDAIATAERSIQEKTLSLAKIKKGADDLNIRAKKIAIQQKEDALLIAQQTLADCYVKAPFSGVIVKVDVKKGDAASSGTSIATLVTKQKIAEISLNEVDVAKVKVGQKVTLTFDAIEGLGLTGEVAEIDTLGTVSQGVVTYNVKIVFDPVRGFTSNGVDTQDDRVKPAMSVSAAVITDVKQDVLMVANSAIKTNGDRSYVEVMEEGAPAAPRQQIVEIGSANDSSTEIISGLREGDRVVTQTITKNNSNSSQQSRTQQNNAIRIPGIGGGGFR